MERKKQNFPVLGTWEVSFINAMYDKLNHTQIIYLGTMSQVMCELQAVTSGNFETYSKTAILAIKIEKLKKLNEIAERCF